jgi:hypothetical protein
MKYTIFFLLFSVLGINGQTIGLIEHSEGSLDSGFVLFAPMNANTTYLINKCGRQIKTWNSAYKPALSVYLLPDGTLLHTGKANNSTFTAGGNGGIIEKIDWNGNVTWTYTISDALKCQHHDVKALPNGNILIIAWEAKTNTEAIALGRNPNLIPATVWSEQILEIEPNGASGGTIVWEWHAWDHLVQDFDASKPNFSSIASNPQLVNINYNASATEKDWIHFNAIDYNPSLDQIVVSSHSFSEVWIIDHSTTTAEAASHTGGNSGKGGDLLYRWGNASAYNSGTNATRKFWGQHDAYWIEDGLPFANQIMVFNNGNGRTGGNYSTAEIINTPVNGFNYEATLPYLPTAVSWIYNQGNTNNFYAQNISGAQQLSNGNVLLCNGPAGTFTEINDIGAIVWKYINPVTPTTILTQGSTPSQNLVFKSIFYPNDYSGFSGQTLDVGNTIENTNAVSGSCTLSSDDFQFLSEIKIVPNPTKDKITIDFKNEFYSSIEIELFNALGQKIMAQKSDSNEKVISLESFDSGIYFLKINYDTNYKTYKIIKE